MTTLYSDSASLCAGILWYYNGDGTDNGDMGLLPFDDRSSETAATSNTIQQSTGNRLIITYYMHP